MITLTLPHTWSTAAQANAGDCIWFDGQLWDVQAAEHTREQTVHLELVDVHGEWDRRETLPASHVLGFLIEDGRKMVNT